MSRAIAMYALQRCSRTARVCKTASPSSARRPDHAGGPDPVYKDPALTQLRTTQIDPPCGHGYINREYESVRITMTDRTTLRLSDERKRLLDQASKIVEADSADDPPRSDVIDAALTHLIESHENLEEVRGEYPATTVKDIANTSVLGLRYRTSIESVWR